MKKKTWIETEQQGPGRRYWFDSVVDAKAFFADRQRGGAVGFQEGRTVWLAFSRKPKEVASVLAGIDPLAYQY